jgi:hypothetical protein
MLSFVAFGSVDPNPAGRINVYGPHAHDLSGPHSSQALKLDHRPNLLRNMRADRINECIRNGLNWFGLANFALATPKTGNHFESLVYRWRDQLLADRPLEHPQNPSHPLVDFVPTQLGFDHLAAHGLEPQRAELYR